MGTVSVKFIWDQESCRRTTIFRRWERPTILFHKLNEKSYKLI